MMSKNTAPAIPTAKKKKVEYNLRPAKRSEYRDESSRYAPKASYRDEESRYGDDQIEYGFDTKANVRADRDEKKAPVLGYPAVESDYGYDASTPIEFPVEALKEGSPIAAYKDAADVAALSDIYYDVSDESSSDDDYNSRSDIYTGVESGAFAVIETAIAVEPLIDSDKVDSPVLIDALKERNGGRSSRRAGAGKDRTR